MNNKTLQYNENNLQKKTLQMMYYFLICKKKFVI